MKKAASLVIIALLIFSSISASAASAADAGGIRPTRAELAIKPVKAAKSHVKSTDAALEDISGHWAEKDISELADAGLLKGKGNGKFDPDVNMTRSEFAVILHRIADINIQYFMAPDITKIFNDVKNGDWYANELNDLVTVGIIDDKEHFRPLDPITREEMIHYIMNTYRYMVGADVEEDTSALNKFKDSKEIKPALINDMCRGIGLGLIKGRGNNNISPVDKSTRAEAATVIKRLLSILNGKADIPGDVGVPSTVNVEADYEKQDGSFVMKLVIYNNSGSDIKITHPSGQKYDFVLLDENMNSIYEWSANKGFAQVETYTAVSAGGSIMFNETLDSAYYKDIINHAAYLVGYIKGTSEGFNVNPAGYIATIKSPLQEAPVKVEPAFRKDGDYYTMSVKLSNISDHIVTIQHPSSLKYDFALYNAQGGQIYRMSDGMMALTVIMQTIIEPGRMVEFSEKLNANTYESIINNAVSMKVFINETGENPLFNRGGYEIRIK